MKTMNRIFKTSILLFSCSIIATSVFSKTVKNKENVYGEITIVQGNVFITKNNKKLKVNKGTIVEKKDKITSDKKSKVEITFFDKSKLRINENSEVLLSPISSKKDKLSFLKVLKGQVWANIINKGEGRFAIESKKSIFAVMGTVFDVKNTDNSTEMSVFDGSVGVTNSKNDDNAKNKIKDLKLEIDDNKTKSLAPHQIDKPVQTIEGPKQVSIDEWIEIIKNQKITIEDSGTSTISEITKDDSWSTWNKDLDSKENNN
jgi:hypothetical protein